MLISRLCFSCFLLFGIVQLANARFVSPTYLPVDRLISNASEYLAENPGDASAHFALARIYYLAFANKSELVPTTKHRERFAEPLVYWRSGVVLPYLRREEAKRIILDSYSVRAEGELAKSERPEFWRKVREVEQEMIDQSWEPNNLELERSVAYAESSYLLFQKAIELDPENGLYQLGLASLIEQTHEFCHTAEASIEFSNIDSAKQYYLQAYRSSIEDDLKQQMKPVGGLRSLVGYEAAQNYLRLIEGEESDENLQIREEMTARLKTMDGLPRGMITPIVFSLEGAQPLADLEDRNVTVLFDLDGDGTPQLWSWVKPDTGILVWDPEELGQITSGRQLFGSVTWWIFFSDGYKALCILDDNRDNRLSGPELDGLSVWFDRNSDGVSDFGEVIPLYETNVIEIDTFGTNRSEGVIFNPVGLQLKTGERLPTYDWLAAPKY